MEAIRIIKEMRWATNGKYPRFAVWENVPGAFSSNKGEDFRTVLEEIIKINEPSATVPAPAKGKWPYADTYVGDEWSLAYRTFDAQYWGVPQCRRLTPMECARLQGFADSWGVPDYKESLTDEEYTFWHEVKNTYAEINGRTPKEYTREQILKWYNKLHTNGAEYKMWGNGVALPPTLYVMQGICDVLSGENKSDIEM